MRVLVTGASGFVGGAIAAGLLKSNYEVVGLARRHRKVDGFVQYIQADISSLGLVEQVSASTPACEAIVHAAANLDKDPYAHAICLTNCLGTQQILKLAQMWDVRSFVYISGIQVIGTPKYIPIDEEHPTSPLTAYLSSKLYGEFLTEIARRNGLASSILRLPSPVGPGMPPNKILSVFVKRALEGKPLQLAGEGTRRQNYVDVRDIALAVERCLQEHVEGLFNLGGRSSISNFDLGELCIRVLGSSSSVIFNGAKDPEEGIAWEVSIAKAKKHFRYDPEYTLEESIRAVSGDYAAGTYQ